jgi:predicted peptidase
VEFHVKKSQEMSEAIRAANGRFTYTIYPEGQHNIWTETYDNPAVYEWLLFHKRQPKPTETVK